MMKEEMIIQFLDSLNKTMDGDNKGDKNEN